MSCKAFREGDWDSQASGGTPEAGAEGTGPFHGPGADTASTDRGRSGSKRR